AVLVRLADLLEKAQALRESVRSALIYPALLLAMTGFTIVIMLTVVLPQFQSLFDDAGQSLPLPARIVAAAGDIARTWGWTILPLGLAAALAVRHMLGNPQRRLRWDERVLKLPLAGDLVARLETARFGRTLGTLVGNGVPLLGALGIVTGTVRNQALRRALEESTEALKQGKGLADPLARSALFPPLAVHLVKVGEETGKLDSMLTKVADIFDQEVQRTLGRILALLVPVITVVLGLVVAAILGAILTAILSVNNLPL
ncbi:MAG: type II secretion system F family protein, partial [Rhodospirillales bacterium]|nr:type II secretion system F family protein [Rhodospirillales bacterium]